MKLTIKITSEEQVRKTINFIKELTGKDFKQVKVKAPKSKEIIYNGVKETFNDKVPCKCNWACPEGYCHKVNKKAKDIKVKDEEILKFPKLIKGEITDFLNRKKEEKSIHGEGLRCHPNCVNGILYDCNVTGVTKCNRCKQSNMYFGSASVIPNKAWIDEND